LAETPGAGQLSRSTALTQDLVMDRKGILLVILVLTLTWLACGRKLPPDVKEAVLARYGPASQVGIYSFKRAELLPKDVQAGVEEAWCVSITFRCKEPAFADRGDFITCADGRLVHLIDGEWGVSLVLTEADKEDWDARGCDLPPEFLGGP
jgi:hypothetical protein